MSHRASHPRDCARRRRDWRDERGVALIIALLATVLLTALGIGLVLLTNTETVITANYRDGQEALYAADAGVERVVQDLLSQNDWNQILAGGLQSGFFDGNASVTLANGAPLDVEAVRANLQAETDTANTWGTNDPAWQWYGRGYASAFLPGGGLDNRSYIVAFVGDDPSEIDGDPTRDTNGVVTIHVEAFAANGAHKVLEVTVSRTASTEIERGYIAQRGQEELNQRARKAAVQTPGRSLTNMQMNVTAGTFTQ
jgi:hypothetical protein